MAFWSKRKTEERAETSGLAIPSQSLIDALGGGTSTAGQKVTVEKALGLVPVWAAVSIISEQISMLPLKVYREVDGREQAEAPHDSRGWMLLHDMPNPYTPAGRFWATVSVHLLLWGNAFVLKQRNADMLVDELYLLPPENVTVLWNPSTREKQFRYQPPAFVGIPAEAKTFTDDDVLHIFGLSINGIVGESVIAHLRNPIGAALARDEYESGFYNRGAKLQGVLQAEGQLSDQAKKNLKESFKGFQGSGNSFGTPVLEEGVEFKPVASLMKDMEFIAAQQLTRTDIAVMFKLPPNTLGGSSGDSLHYSTVEMEQTAILLNAVAPVTNTIQQFVTNDPSILPQRIFSCAFLLDATMAADAKTQAEVYTAALGDDKHPGWMTPEEVRLQKRLFPAKLPTTQPALPGAVGEDVRITQPTPGIAPGEAPARVLAAVNGNGSGG